MAEAWTEVSKSAFHCAGRFFFFYFFYLFVDFCLRWVSAAARWLPLVVETLCFHSGAGSPVAPRTGQVTITGCQEVQGPPSRMLLCRHACLVASVVSDSVRPHGL